MPSVHDLPTLFSDLSGNWRAVAQRMFSVDHAIGQLQIPTRMEAWVLRQFGSLAAISEQRITRVTNRYTLESALFNPLRGQRPSSVAASDAELEQWIADELTHDMFANPLHETTADSFGRIYGEYCVSASNIAKYAGWHGLVIPNEPHPLRFNQAQIRDYLDVALRWVASAQAIDSNAQYPLITWNCLPKSGATIVHAHWQIAIANGLPYTRVEFWRRAIRAYHEETRRDYIDDLYRLHEQVGLDFSNRGVRSFIHLTPLRGREVVVVAAPAAAIAGSQAAQELADGIYCVLRALIDILGTRTFNLAIALPSPDQAEWQGFPVLVRIGDRGPALTTRGDLGAMELYGTGVIAADPFDVARAIKR